MDIKSLLRSRWLFMAGAVLCYFYITINGVDYDLKEIGVFMVFSGLCLLVDLRATFKFSLMFYTVLTIWALNLTRCLASFFGILDLTNSVIYIFNIIIFCAIPFSVILFCMAMVEFTKHYNLLNSVRTWKNSTIINTIAFGIPGSYYLIMVILTFSGLMSNSSMQDPFSFSFHIIPSIFPSDWVSQFLFMIIVATLYSIPLVNFYLAIETINIELNKDCRLTSGSS